MQDDLFSVEGQVVLLSGGSRGIGRAIAAGFAARGARVVIVGRDRKTLEATAREISPPGAGDKDDRVRFRACDVADATAIGPLVDAVFDEFGRIDTLVNVAGVNRRKAALEVSEAEYDLVLGVNLKGAFLLSQAVGRRMLQQGGGSQINIASLATDRPLRHSVPYAMSKSGLGQMTRGLAMEWGPQGVRVNAIAPGFVVTDLTRKIWADETMREWGVENTPLRRLAAPEDMVGAAIFLASPASAFLTGQVLYVDGGFAAGWAWPIPE